MTLTVFGALAFAPAAWSASDLLVYQDCCPPGGTPKLMRAYADGTGATPWLSYFGIGPETPALSPYGDRLAFEDVDAQTDLHTVYITEGDSIRALIDGSRPRFSPDETKLILGRVADIYTIGIDGSALTPVITWPGSQGNPVFSPDGTKIAFDSSTDPTGKTLRSPSIYVANANGSNPVLLGAGQFPTFSPDGSRVAYETVASVAQIAVMNSADGRNNKQLTRDTSGAYRPTWSPDGSKIAFEGFGAGSSNYAIKTINPDGTAETVLIPGAAGSSKFDPAYRQPSTTVGFYDSLVTRFWPDLMFDNSESWRPLNVDAFFGEGNHQVCDLTCNTVTSAASLRYYPSSNATLDIAGSGSETNYTSPYPDCNVNGLRDCDSGPRSNFYYHVSSTSPGGYHYLDFWYFYRYNYFSDVYTGGNHEADWESVSVAPALGSSNTFDFASFSQHGTWYSYLRGALSCDGGGDLSCGSDSAKTGTRVNVFPANGDHANYAGTCHEIIYGDCWQQDGITPERGHDGAVPWGGNTFSRLPATNGWADPSIGNWTDWPGKWGIDRAVDSPATGAHAEHFNSPWISTCYRGECTHEARMSTPRLNARSALRPREAASAPGTVKGCANWFGGDVTVLACAPSELSSAVDAGKLGRGGTFALAARGGRAANAPGIAQLLRARPLGPGSTVRISGDMPHRTVLLARARVGRYAIEVNFDHVRSRTGAPATLQVFAGKHFPKLRLKQPNGHTVSPTEVIRFRLPKLSQRTTTHSDHGRALRLRLGRRISRHAPQQAVAQPTTP